MKKGIVWIALTILTVSSLVLASCTTSTTATTKSTAAAPTTKTTSVTSTASVTSTIPTSKTTSTTTTTAGNWWDSLGTPQYGGEIVLRTSDDVTNFDPYYAAQLVTVMGGWMEPLFGDDWTLDPSIFDYKLPVVDFNLKKGRLAERWEFTDASTFVVYLRKGIHWQDIPPVNGRELTADDIVFHYGRQYGVGGGFTKPSPYAYTTQSIVSATAIDKYTIVFKHNISNPPQILINMQMNAECIEAPEAVKLWGDVRDWHHAIGTGPFMLKDFVPGSSATMVKVNNYWDHDERYPKNQLPYADSMKILIIPDLSTSLAAMRTGKIDILTPVSADTGLTLKNTDPKILQISLPASTANTIDPRNDVKPFNDIRVRKALQMAIDLPTIAKTYYLGRLDPIPSSLTSIYQDGGGFPYQQWPQDLKDEYAYNPTAAKKLLADAGYPTGFKTNIVVDSAADLNLLQIVKSYYSDIGIDMTIKPMDTTSWVVFVMTNHSHDQLAQRGTGALGQTQTATAQLNRFRTGVRYNYCLVTDSFIDKTYDKGIATTDPNELAKLLRDENEYIARQHLCVSLLTVVQYALCQPWLKAYNGQANSTGNNALQMSFYEARFWIDQSIKKSMGH